MGLELTLTKVKRDSLFIKIALTIAMESYTDLQNGYGILMRSKNLLDAGSIPPLITRFENAAEGDTIIIRLPDLMLLVTAFDITYKILGSPERDRFFHALQDDDAKRLKAQADIREFCRLMLIELSEQAIYRMK